MKSPQPRKPRTRDPEAQFIFGRRLTSEWLADLKAQVRNPSPIILDALALANISLDHVIGALAVGVVPMLDHHFRYVFIEELTRRPLISQWHGLRWLRLDPITTSEGSMSLCIRINQRGLEAK